MKAERYTHKSTIGIIVFCLMNVIFFHQEIQAQEVKKGNSNKPDVRVKVNKEFDSKGNLTRYDSTYSYSWSDTGQIPIDVDSVFGKFRGSTWFEHDSDLYQSSFFDSKQFNQLFRFHSNRGLESKNDSIEYPESFDDYFQRHRAFIEPFLDDSSFIPFDKEFEDMMNQNKKLMDYFFNQNPFRHNPEHKDSQKDTIQLAPAHKQNEILNQRSSSSTIWI